MDTRSIELFYNTYKNSIDTISALENKLLGESDSYERWHALLREKSRTIRDLYAENERLYAMTVGELTEHPEQLTHELAEMFLTHVDFFLSEGYRDYAVTVKALTALTPFFEGEGNRERTCDCYYFMGLSLLDAHMLPEADDSFRSAIAVYPDLDECKEGYRRYHVMCSYLDRLLICRLLEKPEQAELLARYNEAKHVWTTDVPEGFLTPKKEKVLLSVLRILVSCAVGTLLYGGVEEILPELKMIVFEEYELETEGGGRPDPGVFTVHNRLRLLSGEIGEDEYRKIITGKYMDIALRGTGKKFSYGTWDFVRLFDDELPDSEVDRNKLYYANSSFTFVQYLLPAVLRVGSDELRDGVLDKLYSYYSRMEYISGGGIIDILTERSMRVYLHYATDIEKITTFCINVFVHRQICTAIHSMMVSRLAELIMEHLIKSHPAELSRLLGVEEARIHTMPELWAGYAGLAGICHDVGKIICSEIVNLQSRRICDEEFAMIKRHPGCGARILEGSAVMDRVADIAHGHHRTYDGKGGYPADFDNTASPQRALIDIICICDSVDAATDRLGRNYARAKTFSQVMGELVEQGGTRYNAEIVEMIADDPALVAQMDRLTGSDRAIVQYEVYKNYVKPEMGFAALVTS